MSKNTNPRQPWRASIHAQSPAARAKKALRDIARRYLQGITTPKSYRQRYAELSAEILAGGLDLPDVPPPPTADT